MNFFEHVNDDREAQELLHATLACIDTWDANFSSNSSSTTTSSAHDTSACVLTPLSPLRTTDCNHGVVRSNAEAVRRSRVKKKAEVQQLREQLQQLEHVLRQLQHQQQARDYAASNREGSLRVVVQRKRQVAASNARDATTAVYTATQAPSSTHSWRVVAATQARARREAEQLNAQLVRAVAHYRQLRASLEPLLQHTSSSPQRTTMRDEQRSNVLSDLRLTLARSVFADLQQRVRRMHVDASTVFAHPFWGSDLVERASMPTMLSRLTLDALSNSLKAEIRSTAPVTGDALSIGTTLWQRTVGLSKNMTTPHYSMVWRHPTTTSFEKDFSIRVDGPNGPVVIQGALFADTHYEETTAHFTYVWASVMHSTLRNGKETFYEQGWMVALPSFATTRKSVFRVFHEIWSDATSVGRTDDEQAAEAQRVFVLKLLSRRTQAYHEFIENQLLDTFVGVAQPRQRTIALIIPSCLD